MPCPHFDNAALSLPLMSRGRIRDEGGGDNGTWIAQKALLKEFFDIFAGKKGYNPETSGGNFLSGNRRRILFVTSSIWFDFCFCTAESDIFLLSKLLH